MSDKLSQPRRPLAWSRNPSSLRFRARVAALGAVSSITLVFLIPILGETAPYLITASLVTSVLALSGNSSRWRTAPWLVMLNLSISVAASLIPLFIFTVLKPALANDPSVIGFALTALAAIMSGYLGDEALASLQTMKRLSEHGRKVRRMFFGLSPVRPSAQGTITLRDLSRRLSKDVKP
jgi:hypothetical protein